MSLKKAISSFLSRSSCEKLIKYDTKSIEMGALGAEFGGVKFSLASFKTRREKVRDASEAAKALDDYDYKVCKIANECEKGSPERKQYNRWRIGALSLFTGLRMTLIAFKENQSEELTKELESLTKDMRDFVRAIAKAVASPVKTTAKPLVRLGKVQVSARMEKAPLRRARVKAEAELPSADEVLSRAFKVAGLKSSDVERIAAQV